MARRIRSRGVGRSVAHGHLRRAISERPRPIFSAPFARSTARARDWFYRPATPRRWPCISKRSPLQSRPAHTPFSSSIKRRSNRFPSDCGGMARLEDAPSAAQHYTRVIAAEIARTQPGRKYLAVHEGQLAVKPSFHLPREHRRPLLLCLEQTGRSAMADHVHRNSPVGKPVMLMKTWYYHTLFFSAAKQLKGTERWGVKDGSCVMVLPTIFSHIAFGIGRKTIA